MGKTLKILVGTVVGVIVVVAIVMVLLVSNLDRLVKEVVERVGPQATGTAVTLSSVNISLKDGAGSLRGLVIGNPEGFESDYAFRLGEITLRLDPKSVTSDVIVIEELIVDGAKLIAEQRGKDINLDRIRKNVQSFTGPAASEEGAGEAEQAASETRLIIKLFRFSNAGLTVMSDLQDKPYTTGMDEVVVRGIGERSAGATVAEAVKEMLQPVLNESVQAAKDSLAEQGKDRLKDKADEKLKDLLGG